VCLEVLPSTNSVSHMYLQRAVGGEKFRSPGSVGSPQGWGKRRRSPIREPPSRGRKRLVGKQCPEERQSQEQSPLAAWIMGKTRKGSNRGDQYLEGNASYRTERGLIPLVPRREIGKGCQFTYQGARGGKTQKKRWKKKHSFGFWLERKQLSCQLLLG